MDDKNCTWNTMNHYEPSAFIGFQMLDKTLQLRSPHRAMLGERTKRAARFSSPAFPATPQHAQSCLQHSCTDGHMDIPHAIYLTSRLSKRQQNSSKFNKHKFCLPFRMPQLARMNQVNVWARLDQSTTATWKASARVPWPRLELEVLRAPPVTKQYIWGYWLLGL